MFRRVTILEYERGLLIREGRLVGVLDPGPHWVRGEVVRADLRRRTAVVDHGPVFTRDAVPVGVQAQASYRVLDPRAAWLNVTDVGLQVTRDAQSSVVRAVSAFELSELSREHNRLELDIQDRLALEASAYGVRVEGVAVVTVRYPKAIRRQLKRQGGSPVGLPEVP
jgi:regulator of protease activity HflC (stomatin/prohibitin superfamily)